MSHTFIGNVFKRAANASNQTLARIGGGATTFAFFAYLIATYGYNTNIAVDDDSSPSLVLKIGTTLLVSVCSTAAGALGSGVIGSLVDDCTDETLISAIYKMTYGRSPRIVGTPPLVGTSPHEGSALNVSTSPNTTYCNMVTVNNNDNKTTDDSAEEEDNDRINNENNTYRPLAACRY